MNPDLRRLVRKGKPSNAAIDAFISSHTFPLVDGTDVTFLYRGQADEIYLRRWIYGVRAAQPLQRVEGTDLWVVTMEVPEGSRFEYKFELHRGGHKELVLDPLNKIKAHDPFGANSVCQGDRYQRPAWTLPDPDARSGTVERLTLPSRALGSERSINLYLPARFRRSRQYPLLIVHDGVDYLRYAELKTVLDNLIHRMEIPALIVALTDSPNRLKEYGADRRHAEFVADELVTYLGARYPLIDAARSRALMGASFGGVAALHAAWSYPKRFGRLLLQSGSFAFSDLGSHQRGPVFDPVAEFINTFRRDPVKLAYKIYLSCGVYESLIYENRSLVPLLQQQGMRVKFEEARDAHNWENWRDRLRSGLSWTFPGPLLMVYE